MSRTALLPHFVLAALCLPLYVWGLGSTPLVGLDEGMYAESSREMLASGNYVVPTFNGRDFYDKPPFVYWMQAGSMRLFGVSSFAARLPSAVAGMLLVAWTVLLGTRLFSPRAGLMAGFVLATSILGTALARMAVLDQTFALAISVALGAYALAYLGKWPRIGYMLFWAACGVSLLVKGPAGLVLVFGSVFVFLLIRRDLRSLRNALPLGGVMLMALIALPWYVLVQKATGGAFLKEFIIHQNLQRAAGEDFSHNQSGLLYIAFYPIMYLLLFQPWSVFVPLAWKKCVGLRREDAEKTAGLFLATWLVAIVAVFTLLVSKLTSYIYPAFPPSALLIGAMWAHAKKTDGRALRNATVAAAIVAAVTAAALVAAPAFLKPPMPELKHPLEMMAGALLAGAVVAATTMCRWREAAFAAMTAGVLGFLLFASQLGLPRAGAILSKPMVEMAREIRRRSDDSFDACTFRLRAQQAAVLPFYALQPTPETKTSRQLRDALESGKSLVLTEQSQAGLLPDGGKLLVRRGKYLLYRFNSSR